MRRRLGVSALIFVLLQLLSSFFFTAQTAFAETSDTEPQAQVLQSVQGESGEWFWQLRISGTAEFAGSWESKTGSFANSNDLIAAIEAQSACRSSEVQNFFAGFADQKTFLSSVSFNGNGTWYSSELNSAIKTNCLADSAWQPKSTGFFDSTGQWVALIPYSQFGVGSHELFLIPATLGGSSSLDTCKKTWPDGGWNGFDCQIKYGDPVTFSVKVSQHTLSAPQIQGPPVAAQSFFDQSAFSTLKPVNFNVLLPTAAGSAGAVGVLAVLVSFPTMLLSKSIDEMHKRFSNRDRFRWVGWTVSGLWALFLFFIAAIIDGFSDPSFGFTFKALRVLITGFLAFVVMDMGRNHIAWLITRKHSGQEYPLLTAKPFFLLVIAGTMLFARITNIDPTMVFGSVVGLELGSRISAQTKGVVKFATTAYTFVIGVICWFGYSWLTTIRLFDANQTLVDTNQANFITWLGMCLVSSGEFLSMIAVSAFSTIPLSLLPFAGLGGKPLLDWKRWVWVLTYFVGLLAYVIVVLPLPRSWSQPSEPFSNWIGVLIAYSVVSIVAFAAVTWRNAREKRLAR